MAGKIITINWQTIASLPSDEYYYKLLNKQQMAVLLALCEYQYWETRWDNLTATKHDLARFMGDIEYRLMRNEDIVSIDYDAMKAAMCEAIECGIEKVAIRYINGTVENLIGGEIILTPNQPPQVITPGQVIDNPETLTDEEARAGAASAIRTGINKIFTDVDQWFTGGVSLADAKTRLLALYDLNQTEAEAFVDYYYTTYALPANSIGILSSIESYLYCDGLNTQSIARYVYDAHTPVGDKATIIKLLPALGNQLRLWQNSGEQVPSSSYVSYSCVPVDDDSVDFINPLSTSGTITLNVTQKVFHRIRFTASGKTYNPDGLGGYQDFAYSVSAAGVRTLLPNSTGMDYFGGVFVKPTSLELPFEPSGNYVFTRDTIAGGIPQFRYRTSWGSGGNGTISLELEDLGEYV